MDNYIPTIRTHRTVNYKKWKKKKFKETTKISIQWTALDLLKQETFELKSKNVSFVLIKNYFISTHFDAEQRERNVDVVVVTYFLIAL